MKLSHSREFQFPVPTQLWLQRHFGESSNFSLDRAILGGSPAPAVTPAVLQPGRACGYGAVVSAQRPQDCPPGLSPQALLHPTSCSGALWGGGCSGFISSIALGSGLGGKLRPEHSEMLGCAREAAAFCSQPLAGIACAPHPMWCCREEQGNPAWETA